MTTDNKKKYEYLFVLRPSMKGIYVASWHQITEDENETKAVLFGMKMSSMVNVGSGICKIMADEEWTPELLEVFLRSKSQAQLEQFVKEAQIEARSTND